MNKLTEPIQTGLRWLFVDMNSYFASVEQDVDPRLRGKPVAVVPMMTDATCAIAASYEAKAYGVRTGTKIYEAKRMCPQLICVQARHDLYVEYHHRILRAVENHLPVHKVWSIDEFDCELMGRECVPENARKLALAIKESIHREVGPAIHCSIGIAPNSFLGKVATEIDKPNGLVIIRPEDLPGRLLALKLRDLPGINVNMEERLRRARITSVRDLWQTSPKQARAIWHSVQGERFWYWLHGYDVPYHTTNISMVGHSRILDPDMRRADKARLMARRLLVKAALRLRRKGFYARRLSFSARLCDGRRWQGEADFPAAHDPFTFLEHLNVLWGRMLDECFVHPRAPAFANKTLFKKVSVVLHGLQKNDVITNDLFETGVVENRQARDKRERLVGALDHLQDKYKREIVSLGVTPQTLAGHVGTKIAFSRVPDQAEFED